MSYQDYRKMKAWRQKQEQAQKAREALRPLADALASISDPLDLDSLPVPDLDLIPDPLTTSGKTTQENSSLTAGETAERI